MPNADDSTVHVRRDERAQGAIAYLTIDDGRGLNVMSSAVMDALAAALLALANDEDLRAVVLSGAGAKAFSAGADIKEMAAIENPEAAKALITRLHRSCDAIRNLPVPVIAKIGGFCFGAGLEVAVACDAMASDAASFGMTSQDRDSLGDRSGAVSVADRLGPRARSPFARRNLRCERGAGLGIDRARRAGVKPRPGGRRLDRQALDLGAACSAAAKALIRQWEDLPLSGAITAGIDAFAAAYETDEPRAAMRKFLAAQKARKTPG